MSRRAARKDPANRVRQLIALDASNVVKRLHSRQEEMVRLFSRTRDRSPLTAAIHSWFQTVTFGELVLLEPFEQRAVNHFYEVLGELRWYVEYTEDMPLQVQTRLVQFAAQLDEAHRGLTQAIGPADGDGVRVVEGSVRAATSSG